jgi:thioredoxin
MGKLIVDLRVKAQENLFHFLTQNAKVCVVDFYADWCGPCKQLGMQLEKTLPSCPFANSLFVPEDKELTPDDVKDKVVFVKVNVDEFGPLAATYKVSGIPHVIFYKNGDLQPGVVRGLQSIYDTVGKLL